MSLPRQPVRLLFFTYAIDKGLPADIPPLLAKVNCAMLTPPPDNLQDRFTGIDRPVIEQFWSYEAAHAEYHKALAGIRRRLDRLNPSRYPEVSVGIYCTAGAHRSVAMAERLYRRARTDWTDVTVYAPRHYELARAIARRRRR